MAAWRLAVATAGLWHLVGAVADGECGEGMEADEESCMLQVHIAKAVRHWPHCDYFTPCMNAQDVSCYWEAETKCCLEDECKGCSGEQCQLCREDPERIRRCCQGSYQDSYAHHAPAICRPPTNPPYCDSYSPCKDISGAEGLTCMWGVEANCCLDHACRGCGGEQCQYCREEKHKVDHCCEQTYSPDWPAPEVCKAWVEEHTQPTPAPTPAPYCDSYTPCKDIYGAEGLSCMWGVEAKCCLDHACRGCSGEQCQYCREKKHNVDHCCEETYYPNWPAPEVCKSWFYENIQPTPAPSPGPARCPGSNNACHGNQCCPGIPESNGLTFPCPNAESWWNGCAGSLR